MVAAAVIGGAVVGAAGSAYAGSQAAGATRDATTASIQQQQQALAQQETLSAPYRKFGESALPTLQQLLGISTDGKPVDPLQATKTLQSLPGYQFAKQQGLDATKNSASSMGLALSGNTLQALDKFSTGLADQTYQQTVNNLQTAVGTGQAAAAGQAVNVGNSANNNSAALLNQGSTLAGIDANTTAGITKSIGNGVNQYMTSQTLADIYGSGGGGGAYPVYGAGSGGLNI